MRSTASTESSATPRRVSSRSRELWVWFRMAHDSMVCWVEVNTIRVDLTPRKVTQRRKGAETQRCEKTTPERFSGIPANASVNLLSPT